MLKSGRLLTRFTSRPGLTFRYLYTSPLKMVATAPNGLGMNGVGHDAANFPGGQRKLLAASLAEYDPEVVEIIKAEEQRQKECVVLIASENFTPRAVSETQGCALQNKYSEGYPGKRYYGGTYHCDQMETLCQNRAREAFGLTADKWGVNVQALSGAPANLAVWYALAGPGGRLMGLDLPHGGHLSHGYQTESGKKISATSAYFETMPYRLDPKTGLIDYDMLEQTASLYKPKVLIGGASAYSRVIDWARMKQIAEKCGAYFVVDMAHISGLVAGGVHPSPFDAADVVTTTTHKSLRGPRAAMIFMRRGVRGQDKAGKDIIYDLEERINASVFPGHQGGPHNDKIAALTVALKQVRDPSYIAYQQQIVLNARTCAEHLISKGHTVVSNGTDNHLILVDLKPDGVDGARVERVLELVNIALNKNAVPGDKSALVPGGIRIGTPSMTSRGCNTSDFTKIADYIHQAIEITKEAKAKCPGKKVAEFSTWLGQVPGEMAPGQSPKPCEDASIQEKITTLRDQVKSFAISLPVVGE